MKLIEGTGKAISLHAWTGPEEFQELEAPHFSRKSAHEVGKVVSLTHRPPLPPRNISGTHFC